MSSNLSNQFKIYSVDTKAFYNEKERELNANKFIYKNAMDLIEQWAIHIDVYGRKYIELEDYKNKLIKLEELKKNKEKTPTEETEFKELKEFFKKPKKKKLKYKEYKTTQEKELDKKIKTEIENKEIKGIISKRLNSVEEYIYNKEKLKEVNKELENEMKKSKKRILNRKALTPYNQITLFENSLSRAMGIKKDEAILDMIIVRAYHYEVLKQLIENGFDYIDEDGVVHEYKVFTASAGQIRTKKVIFIKKEQWEKYEKTLMCGLTIDDINNSKEQGCNINKFLAYLALCNSATEELKDFDIERTVVIDDFETNVYGEVDYIDNKTFEVTRRYMDVLIPHSDGCGWVHPSVSKKNFMIRLPWVKGLVTPVDYIKFCDEYNNGNYKIKDIYGKEWDLKEDKIQYVFTKSQFKMYKYYNSWDEYVEYFKKFNCKGNYCNLEPDTKEFRKACFNYQMWQTLTDITDEEIASFTDEVDKFITDGYSNRKTMLKLLGADSDNLNKTYIQKCLEIYPELIRDYHVKEELASQLNARKKEAKYGKFKVDATYTFLIPDVFAWLENVFLGHKVPIGLLRGDEVSCRLYKEKNKLLVNRSPHLYREHAVRNNVVDERTKKWFITDGIYTSTYDLISKILQFDVDGDRALVVADDRLIPIAERNMKNIVPLYYEMGKAKAQIINESHIYESLTKAFKFNNIGKFSNKLTVMWNLDNPDKNIETIAQITALNNFTIDAAKTLLVPEVPSDVEEKMKASNGKLPYFFQFAKDKDKSVVAEINNSTVNRICRNIENIKQCNYDFSSIGKFNKNYLMNNSKIEINDRVINKYKELEKDKNQYFALAKATMGDDASIFIIYKMIKEDLLKLLEEENVSEIDAVDMIIRYIYTTNRNSKKGLLFDLFGDIIYNNLKSNIAKPLGEYIMCECCGERVKLEGSKDNSLKYCVKCSKDIRKKQTREAVKRYRQIKMM